MAYDQALAARINSVLSGQRGIEEKKMFGGVGFLLHGNMCCGVHKDSLMVRVDPRHSEAALSDTHVEPFDITGRPMKGWLLIEAAGVDDDRSLRKWIGYALEFVATLPPK